MKGRPGETAIRGSGEKPNLLSRAAEVPICSPSRVNCVLEGNRPGVGDWELGAGRLTGDASD